MAEQPTRLPAPLKYQPEIPPDWFLHEGEPFFLLRAQDVLALGTLAYYHMAAEASAAPNAQSTGAILVSFAEWQQKNQDLVKLPD